MASNTTIIFVPGAWHTPDCFSLVVELLEQQGYKTDLVYLPSVGPLKLPDFSRDVEAIQEHVSKAVDAGQEVVVVSHSYGGTPASEALKGFGLESRRQEGKKGGVKHLFFITVFLVPVGESMVSYYSRDTPVWHIVSDDGMEVFPGNPEGLFYNDLSDAEAEAAVKKLKPFSRQTFFSRLTYTAWKDIPSTYLYTLNDTSVPIEFQRKMVEQGLGKGYFHTEAVDASHSPFLSKPKETAAAIARAAQK